MVAIAEACQAGEMPVEIVLVLSDVPHAGILDRARDRGISARHLPPGEHIAPSWMKTAERP